MNIVAMYNPSHIHLAGCRGLSASKIHGDDVHLAGFYVRAHTRGITGRGHSVTAGGQPGGGVRGTEDQGGQAEGDSSYQAGPEEEAGDGGPSVGLAGQAGRCLHRRVSVHRKRTSRRTLWTWDSHLR